MQRHQSAFSSLQHAGTRRASASWANSRIRSSKRSRAVRFGPGPERKSIKPHAIQRNDGRAQRLGRRLVEDDPGAAVLDALGAAALAEDDRRAAAGERLERHDAGVLDAGHQHRATGAIELAQLEVADVSEELDLGRSLRAKPRGFRPAADDPQAAPAAAVGLEAQLEPLVGRERGDDEVVLSRHVRSRREEAGVDRRRDHGRVAAVVAADAAGDVRAVRGEVVDAHGALRIPRPQPRRDGTDREARQRRHAAGAEVVVVAVPHVAHRRVAVAEVERARRRAHALGDAVRAREDEIEAREVERFGRARKERQVVPVARRHGGQVLHEGRADLARLELRGDRARDVEQREDRGLGIEPGEREQHLLAAAHARQPVVDEGDLQLVASAVAGTVRPSAFR